MSKKIVINKFDGGLSEDEYTTSTNLSSNELLSGNLGFDITINEHLLRPHSDAVAETISSGSTIMTDFQITDVIPITISNALVLCGLGRESLASSKLSFFTKASPISTAWAKIATIANSESPQAGTLVEYKGVAYAIANSATAHLYQFTTGTTTTEITITGSPTRDTETPKPFVHPEDNILYFGINNVVYAYNGSGSATVGITLPTNVKITSLTNFGSYLAIACKFVAYDSQLNALSSGKSIVYLWGRNTSITTLQGIIDWGTGELAILENINETLVGVSSSKTIGTYDTLTNYNLIIKTYSGGSPTIVKEYTLSNANILRPWKAKQYDKLYFGFDTDGVVHCFGKNKNGNWFLSRDRCYTPSGGLITGTLNNISMVGDILFAAYTEGGTAGYFTRTSDSTYVNTSAYTTTINPNMPVEDRSDDKKLVNVQVSYKMSSSSGTVGLYYYCENNSGTLFGTAQTAISTTKSAAGVYTSTASEHTDGTPFLTGRDFKFKVTSTGGIQIKEIKYVYEKMNTI